MIYKFSGTNSIGCFEIQVHGPRIENIQRIKRSLKTALAKEGFRTGPLQYEGSLDLEAEGLVIPDDAAPDKHFILVLMSGTPSVIQTKDSSEKGIPFVIRGWYTPGGNEPALNKCAVDGCEGDAVFFLCDEHAVPGGVVGPNVEGARNFVISNWLVEVDQRVQHFTIYDLLLGEEFGGRAGFESRLSAQGYKVVALISSEAELDDAEKNYTWLRPITSNEWFSDFLEREAKARIAS